MKISNTTVKQNYGDKFDVTLTFESASLPEVLDLLGNLAAAVESKGDRF